MMDHPNIARVLDGAHRHGPAYFVMELVKGVRITEYAIDRQLTTGTAGAVIRSVRPSTRDQKSIIHRTSSRPTSCHAARRGPVPKVIDFGIAKPRSGADGENHLYAIRPFIARRPI